MQARELKRRLMYGLEIFGPALEYSIYTISRDEFGLNVDLPSGKRYSFRQLKYQRQVDGVLALVLDDDRTQATRIQKSPMSREVEQAS